MADGSVQQVVVQAALIFQYMDYSRRMSVHSSFSD